MEVADGSLFQRDRRIVFISSHFVPSFDLFRLKGMMIRAIRRVGICSIVEDWQNGLREQDDQAYVQDV